MLLPKTPVIKKMTKDVSDSGHWVMEIITQTNQEPIF